MDDRSQPAVEATTNSPNPAYAFAGAFFEELERAGLRHVCVSPGSRSTPLAVTAARRHERSLLRVWSHVDERGAAFFALGLAKATRSPVALVCTSGTAAANFLPAVVEAHYARVPLLVLSADRPPELREWGAGQTIDQPRLFGSHVRWFAELPVPRAGARALRYARALACRALESACGRPAGPVHLNWPLREPLEPAPSSADPRAWAGLGDEGPGEIAWGDGDPLAERGRPGQPYTQIGQGVRSPSPDQVAHLVELVESVPRGVIVSGPGDGDGDFAEAVARLAAAAGWPILADATSQLRRGAHTRGACVLGASDLLLRDDGFATRSAPDAVLRVGGAPVSKALRMWLERRPPRHFVLVDPDGAWEEPSFLVSELLRVDPSALCCAVARRLESRPRPGSGWLRGLARAEADAQRAIARGIEDAKELLEPAVVRELAAGLPRGATLYVSNSMPIRDLDAFLPVSSVPLRVLCNRGANGIDGMVSSALGAAAAAALAAPGLECAGAGLAGDGAAAAPVVLLTGDLAFLHDVGGLLTARRHGLRLVVVVMNNDGGGIFSYLPVARYGETVAFEELFRTPHGLDLRPAAELYGASFARARSGGELRSALEQAIRAGGTSLIEVPIDRDASVRHHQELSVAVSEALRRPYSFEDAAA